MNRTTFALMVFCAPALGGFATADACSVSGTAYDADGRPLRDAIVRLVDLHTRDSALRKVDATATFAFDLPDSDHARYRLDVLGASTVVTGTHLPTRSVTGMSPQFSCAAGQVTRQDVHDQAG